MNKLIGVSAFLTAALALGSLAGCKTDGDDPSIINVPGMGGTGGMGTPMPSSASCRTYCSDITTNCQAALSQYKDEADCLAYCNGANWPAGNAADQSGNSIACRLYHSDAAKGDPAIHCAHAGPAGGDVCGQIDTRTDPPTAYVRVDRMGNPAVATALVSDSARKSAFNDGNPANDVKDFLADWAARLKSLHDALDDDVTARGATPCSMVAPPDGLPPCLTQNYAPGRTVASLVAPSDVLRLSTTLPAGFPNGRRLEDQVIDLTLGVLLLDLTRHPADLLAKLPINPGKNDIAGGTFLTTFPYFHLPHQP
jgi:hypothetical protein